MNARVSLALVGAFVVGLGMTGCSKYQPSQASLNSESCVTLLSDVEKVSVALQYMQDDMSAQMLSGSYDLDGLRRQLTVMEVLVTNLTLTEGTPEFNAAKSNFAQGMIALIAAFRQKIDSNDPSGLDRAQAQVLSGSHEIASICE